MLQNQSMPRPHGAERLAEVVRHPVFWMILGAIAAAVVLVTLVREAH
jgi:hypothetical protein